MGALKGGKPVRWDEASKFQGEDKIELKNLLEYFWVKVNSKFTKMQDAFRFFDKNNVSNAKTGRMYYA